jgi:hypothetical protein
MTDDIVINLRTCIDIIYECLDSKTKKRVDARLEEERQRLIMEISIYEKRRLEFKNRILNAFLWALVIIFVIGTIAYSYFGIGIIEYQMFYIPPILIFGIISYFLV